MKKKMLAAVVLVVGVLAFSGVAHAAGKGGSKMMSKGNVHGMHVGGMSGMGMNFLTKNSMIAEELGLSEQQTDKIKSISIESQKKTIRAKAELEVLELELTELLDQDKPDLKKIDATIDKIGSRRTEMQKENIHSMIEMKGVLTSEQLEKLEQMKSQRGKSRQNCPHVGQGMGQGQRNQMGSGNMRGMGQGSGPHGMGMGGQLPDESSEE